MSHSKIKTGWIQVSFHSCCPFLTTDFVSEWVPLDSIHICDSCYFIFNIFADDYHLLSCDQVNIQKNHYYFISICVYYYYLLCRKLRNSEAGQMIINISTALLIHHLGFTVYYLFPEPPARILCFLYGVVIIYTMFVILFLMAAEAVNMFAKIVLVFKTIHYYALKASLVSWSKHLPKITCIHCV